ncbi:winged helix-turn-helix domain-containing protein [Propioniciclava tarda]|uniref:winged helix-turn-helix domain-containing protein n=1 Tax=Propioniciclava tarda TaxID=433330 RepID=UPI00116A53FD|nr:helix-turn-helix domain-containing protein [Propioniciclava tarda]SMO76704.1 Transcriptional regulatory protein, C terminal [Propioniciclava tarda]
MDRYPDAFAASRAGVALALSATETKLLIELESTVGRVTRRELLTRVWNDGYAGDSRLVDAAVQRLRAKIEPVPADPTYIQTVRGTGYRMDRS